MGRRLDSATVTNALGAGATTVSSLTTSGDLLMTEDAAVLTHSAASGTSLAISSTNGYVSIGGSYVDVESVRITDAKIGVSGDPDLITLTSGDVAVAGTLSTSRTLNSATVTNALGAGATSYSDNEWGGTLRCSALTVTNALGAFTGLATTVSNHTGPTTMSDTLDVVGATTLESSLALSALGWPRVDVAGDLQHERVRVHRWGDWVVRGRGVGAHHGREDRGEW